MLINKSVKLTNTEQVFIDESATSCQLPTLIHLPMLKDQKEISSDTEEEIKYVPQKKNLNKKNSKDIKERYNLRKRKQKKEMQQ